MITDLETIIQLGETNYDINFRFRSFLKSKDSSHLDSTVNALFGFYSAKIDCTQCGNCCSKLKPHIVRNDIKPLAIVTEKSIGDFKNAFIEVDDEGDMHFKELPCPFLLDRKCTIYELRPNDCRSYPHLHKKDFASRLFAVIDNYSFCPIVFNVYEELKLKFHFR